MMWCGNCCHSKKTFCFNQKIWQDFTAHSQLDMDSKTNELKIKSREWMNLYIKDKTRKLCSLFLAPLKEYYDSHFGTFDDLIAYIVIIIHKQVLLLVSISWFNHCNFLSRWIMVAWLRYWYEGQLQLMNLLDWLLLPG